MSNEKQLIRWERHYSDSSVEYTNEQSTKNFNDNLDIIAAFIPSRSYIQMNPVEWHERKAENSPISDVSGLFSMDFIKWYSGVGEQQILRAYERYKRERL